MTDLLYPLVDAAQAAPLDLPPAEGWAISEFRLPIGGAEGSSTAAYHALYRPGAFHAKHANQGCDEIVICLTGGGVAGQGDGEAAGRAKVRPGHCRLVPRGSEQFFFNDTGEDAVMVGFYLGAPDLAAAGHQFRGAVTDRDLALPRDGFADGVMVHLDDVAPEDMNAGEGWSITDFRLPLGAHNGSPTTLFRARFFPGAIHKKHRHDDCEEIYYVISGHGLAGAGADRVEVRGGHFHYIPKGVEHWLHNLSGAEPIEVLGVYIGAGGVAATGYVFMGEVSAADLAAVTTPSKTG